MSVSFAILLAMAASAPGPIDSATRQHTSRAISALNFGHGLAVVSFWTIPVVFDAGILSMMGAKKTLKNEYRIRYHEDPDEFEESGDAAYWQGWALKGAAIPSFIIVTRLTNEPVLGAFFLAALSLTGIFKHYEASRMLYEQSRHYENGILDEDPPVVGKAPAESGEDFRMRLALDF